MTHRYDTTTILGGRQRDRLTHALRTAAQAFADSEQTMREAAEAGDNGFMTAAAAENLAREFRTYAEECGALEALIDAAEDVRLSGFECETCGEDVAAGDAERHAEDGNPIECAECADAEWVDKRAI
jgi:hypothetical protein